MGSLSRPASRVGPLLRPAVVNAASAPPVRAPVCVLGAGPHGLAAVLHLKRADPALADEIVVIDPSGRWMSTWDNQFAQLGIDVLRSPIVHHPAPDVDALSYFVARRGFGRSGLPYDPPMADAFRAFTRHITEEAELADPLAVRPNRVTAEVDGGGVRIETSGSPIVADRLIVATNPHRRSIPSWVWLLCGQGRAEFAHAHDVDLGSLPDLAGHRVTVVGGGLTAGHLAIGAVERGASVDLVARRPLQIRAFDTDPGWLGPKYLRDFEDCPDPRRRFELARAARGGGTMPQWMRDQLDHDRVTIHEGAQVRGAAPTPDGYCLELTNGESIRTHRVWLATGTTPDLGALRCLEPLLPDIATIGGLPVTDDDLRVGMHPVHVAGRLAIHTLGPAAGNLWGARQAALRITRAITGIDIEMLTTFPEDRSASRARRRRSRIER